MTNCPACNSEINGEPFFYCEKQPVNENVLFGDLESAKASKTGSIDMRFCDNCGFVFNAAFKLDDVDYGEDYQYCEPPTPTFVRFINELSDLIVENYGVRNTSIIEFGCGQGEFLGRLCEKGDNRGFGFDTAYAGPAQIEIPLINFYQRFYDPLNDDVNSSFSCARQVLEHIKNPSDLLDDMAASISLGGKLYLEVPNLDWILKNTVIWDFYFEHCSYFNSASLGSFIGRNGIEVIGSENLFNDQYIGVVGKKTINSSSLSGKNRLDIGTLKNSINEFAVRAEAKKRAIKEKCRSLSDQGPWCIWGGAAKGVTFCNLFANDISSDCAVIDINPLRQNKFVPVVGLPIFGPEKLRDVNPHSVIVMNGNYLDEIEAEIKLQGLDCKVIDVDDITKD